MLEIHLFFKYIFKNTLSKIHFKETRLKQKHEKLNEIEITTKHDATAGSSFVMWEKQRQPIQRENNGAEIRAATFLER